MDVWKAFCFAAFFCFICGQAYDPKFIVMFPSMAESGDDAKLCASLLNPRESVLFSIYLVHNNMSKILLQERVDNDFYRCILFQAPKVEHDSVQELNVEVTGHNFGIRTTNKILFMPSFLTLIQTDKPFYSPGQTVHFRLFRMNRKFVPTEQKYSLVTLEDVHHNRIAQWTNVSSSRLILQLSHKLNPEAPLGIYTLKVNAGNRVIEHSFKVKKYVLPRFEIKVKIPERRNVADEKLDVEVCGRYIFGHRLHGKAQIEVCWNPVHRRSDVTPLCMEETSKLKETGCASQTFNTTSFAVYEYSHLMKDVLDVKVKVEEEGTETSMTKKKTINLNYAVAFVRFADLPNNFHHGSVIEGKIRVTHIRGNPVSNKEVYLYNDVYFSYPKLLQNLTTDINGVAHFSLNTSALPEEHLFLSASVYSIGEDDQISQQRRPYFASDFKYINLISHPRSLPQPSSSVSKSKIFLGSISGNETLKCEEEISVAVNYIIYDVKKESYDIDIFFMVLSRNMIVRHDHEKVVVNASNEKVEGNTHFPLYINADLAPDIMVVAYAVLPCDIVLSDGARVKVEKCLKDKVVVEFSSSEAVPAEKNVLQISAAPGSLCALSVVDRSVTIEEPGSRLSPDTIFDMFTLWDPPEGIYCESDRVSECLDESPSWHITRPYTSNNLMSVVKYVGLTMASNLDLIESCSAAYASRVMHPPQPDTRAVRRFFPETWIWELVEIGESGSGEVPVTVPDTITTWDTEVFCASPKGLGLAPPAHLNVFQPFFLELALPYSIIRGENFELKATVFNFLPKCIMVKVSAAPSSDYTLKNVDEQYSSCLCANGRKTFKWTLVPSVLGVLNITVSAEAENSHTLCNNEIVTVPEKGRVDIVTKSLRVEPEGTEKTVVHNWLLCPKGKSVSEEVELRLPPNVIEGSARASLSVLGEILGRTLNNLDRLLTMPFGCGEQNIALMSPNIYILQYLESTKQLTSAVQERATELLKIGYQTQLNYKLSNGAYSTFGKGDGNTWLSAFVLRSFGRAQRYIFIDPESIQHTDSWLISNQRADGCFRRQGRLYHNRMKGGVNDVVTMTAYITMSLLELGHPITRPAVEQGLSCLRSVLGNLTNTYSTALLAYTFSLAGEIDTRAQLLKDLDKNAIAEGDLLHWSQSLSEESDSLAVEISSYVLLAVLTTSSDTTEDLGYASRIMRWLVTQQNAFGGFFSTQDTVVALQALALYSTKVFNKGGSSTVAVRSAKGETNRFDVNQDNRLLYQEKSLQNIPGKHSIEVSGHACASVQIALFYNIPPSSEDSSLSIEAKTEGNCKTTLGQTLHISLTVTYNGTQAHTNMVIVDVKLLSGFTAETSAIDALKDLPFVERVESKGDHVIMYLKEVQKDVPLHHQLEIKQQLPVKDLKPAVIRIYDYYQPSDQSVTEYSSHCV